MEKTTVGVWQFAPRLRDPAGNAARIAEQARTAGVDLLVTPELSLTGYDLRDDVHAAGRPIQAGDAAAATFGADFGKNAVLLGAVERADTAIPYNAAVLIENGRVAKVQRKVYLPTYGMFDEARYFGRGRRVQPFQLNGFRFGVLVCEDFWHPMLVYLHAMQAADVLIVMAAAPGRGAWAGGEEGGFFASSDAWQRIGRAYAQLYGVYVIVCNRTGVEGGVTFGGESVVIGPDAAVIRRAGIDEELLTFDVERAALDAARTPYAHLRDDDAGLVLDELQRIRTTS